MYCLSGDEFSLLRYEIVSGTYEFSFSLSVAVKNIIFNLN